MGSKTRVPFAWNESRICMSPCCRRLLLYLQLTRRLAAPMIALPNPNPKIEGNLASQYPLALRSEFQLAIFSASNTIPIHKFYCVSLHPGLTRNRYYSCGLKSLDKQQTAMMLLLKQGSRETREMKGPILLMKQALRRPIVLVFDVSFM